MNRDVVVVLSSAVVATFNPSLLVAVTVVEVLDGRSRRVVERYLRSLSEQHRRAIRVVSIGSLRRLSSSHSC